MEMGNKQLSGMPGNKSIKDRLAADMAKLDELEHQLHEELVLLEYDITQAEDELTSLPHQQCRIMRLRYVEGLSWPDVARKSNYSLDYCFILHRKAIENLEKIKE
jgi:DNA-directed RNA polymerase specialized sigma24 family protein